MGSREIREEEDEGFVMVSKVKTGHKREFDFAVKSLSANGGCLGRTRSCRRRSSERIIDEEVQEEECTSIKKKGKMINRDRGRVKWRLFHLLSTGFMEGVEVQYNSIRHRHPHKSSLSESIRGVVKGEGIQCFCKVCKGRPDKVVSPNVFECHAGSRNKRPANYIRMNNGKRLRDVLNACLQCQSEDLEATIKAACGIEADHNCSYGSISAAGNGGTDNVPCDDDNGDDEYEGSKASERESEASKETMKLTTETSEILEETTEGEWDSCEETLQTASRTSYIYELLLFCSCLIGRAY